MTGQHDEIRRFDRSPGGESEEVRRLRQAVRARDVRLEERERQLAETAELVRVMTASRSWRLTRPLRAATKLARKASEAAGRRSGERRMMEALFDADWYAHTYAKVGDPGSLLQDYLAHGWGEGCDPSPLLDGAWYTAEYRDRPSGVSPLEHFVARPYRRRPNRWFDPGLWLGLPGRRHPDVVSYLGDLAVAKDLAESEREAGPVVLVQPGAHQLVDGDVAHILVHYDSDGLFDPYVISTLAALARCGRRVVVVSTSPSLDEASSAQAREHVASILSVPNTGHDWGAYHAGLRYVLDACDPDSVTLMNDSVYVIEDALEPFLERVEHCSADIVGATDSLMHRYHLQSYFLHVRRSALESDLIDEFLTTYVPVSDKTYVINAYEIGFSRLAEERGLTLDAVFPYDALVAFSERAQNPTIDLWDTLLERGFPFVKAQLLREMSPNPGRLRELVPSQTLRLASDHLARTTGAAVRSVDPAANERP